MKATTLILIAACGIAGLIASAGFKPSVRLIYNPTDSAPRGWYTLLPTTRLRVGDLVVARLPRDTAAFAAARGYLPSSVPLLKRVAATAGHAVCVRDAVVYVDGIAAGRLLASDSEHRPLPQWPHCRTLLDGELFLLNNDSDASYDSRYFGPVDASFIRGHAIPLLTRERR